MSVVDLIERSRFWLAGRILIPGRTRRRACVRRGDHRLDLINGGRDKACGGCGTGWPA